MRMPPLASAVLEWIAARQEFALVGLLVLTVGMMMLPVPTALADILIASNISLALMLMMVAIYISAPVEFSTLPTVILITTAFRLSLSITTSRMVLVQGDAGEIIRTFGEFVIAGNVVVGLVVYLIITIVQFVVITKGSERVAEVAARFTLDALPGKQISIDTDLKNGDIDQKEARRRRLLLGKESQLYGAMDGAMKFVKGDAIASLVIIIVNLIGGITIGCLQRGLPFSEAMRTYSLLAVGDGLIAQIPALLISLTSGVIVTRGTSDTGGNLGQDILSQLTNEPKTLQICSVVLVALAAVPGFPTAVFLTLAIVTGAAGWALAARAKERARSFAVAEASSRISRPEPAILDLYLGATDREAGGLAEDAIDALRMDVAAKLGIAVPRLRLVHDGAQPTGGWRLDVNAVPAGGGIASDSDGLLLQLRQCIRGVASQFVGIQETREKLTAMERDYTDLVREASKAAPLPRIADVLRRLLDEQVSISNFRTILEIIAEWGSREADNAVLAQHVRVGLRREICYAIAGPNKIVPVVLIDGSLDEALRNWAQATAPDAVPALDPAVSQRLLAALQQITASRPQSAVLVSPELRRHLRGLLQRMGNDLSVLSHAEVPHDFKLEILGTLQHAQIVSALSGKTRIAPHLFAVGDAT